jgi:hypothetical protein
MRPGGDRTGRRGRPKALSTRPHNKTIENADTTWGNTPNAWGQKIKNAAFLDARAQVLSKGQNPIDMLYEVYHRAIKLFDQDNPIMGLTTDNPSDINKTASEQAAQLLAVATQAAGQIAKYVYPTMGAVKVDVTTHMPKKLDLKAAIEVIKSDPFTRSAVDAIKFTSQIDDKIERDVMPILPTPDEHRSKVFTKEEILQTLPEEIKVKNE